VNKIAAAAQLENCFLLHAYSHAAPNFASINKNFYYQAGTIVFLIINKNR